MKTKQQGLHQEMERFLCPKTGEDQRSFPRLRTIFMSEHTSSPKSNQAYSACQWGKGLILILVQISVLRLLKTLYFAYSVCQCGEGYSSPRPPAPGYATGIRCLEAPPTVPGVCYALFTCYAASMRNFSNKKNFLSVTGPPLTKS